MPNHCENYLTISGKPKLINKLLKQVEITESEATEEHEKTIFSCHKVIPRPAGVDWYDFNVNKWGSKWGAYDLSVNCEDWENGFYALYFQSAWSPILPVVEELAKQHPKLSISYEYWESGMDFWGRHEYQKGKQIFFEEGELSTASCEVRERFYGEAHHWCNNCGESYGCNSNDELCNTCLEEEIKLQEQLLDEREEANENANNQVRVS